MPRKSRRQLAALKGWRTRRAHARARSLAAKRGWETRRLNARASKPDKPFRQRAQMWRVTISAPYFQRSKSKKRSGSIASSYMVRGYFRTEKSAQRASAHLRELAREGRDKVLEENPRSWWTGSRNEVNEEIRSVPFDSRFLNTTEEKDENLDN